MTPKTLSCYKRANRIVAAAKERIGTHHRVNPRLMTIAPASSRKAILADAVIETRHDKIVRKADLTDAMDPLHSLRRSRRVVPRKESP